MKTEIKPYNDNFKKEIILVWEKSVRATHHFLIPSDIEYFKEIVTGIDFNTFQVFCLMHNEAVIGFIGVADKKIEMLFLSPEFIGKGFGRQLLDFAINTLHADEVDVNEQNDYAVKIYAKFGFVTYDRTEKDSEGKNYPILKMKLEKNSKFIV